MHVLSVSPRQHSAGHRPTLFSIYSLTQTILPSPFLSFPSQQQVFWPGNMSFLGTDKPRIGWLYCACCSRLYFESPSSTTSSRSDTTPSGIGRALLFSPDMANAWLTPTRQHGWRKRRILVLKPGSDVILNLHMHMTTSMQRPPERRVGELKPPRPANLRVKNVFCVTANSRHRIR